MLLKTVLGDLECFPRHPAMMDDIYDQSARIIFEKLNWTLWSRF